jgi:hypothetical protein
VREGDSVALARHVWAQVHGIGMLRLEPDLSAQGAGTRFCAVLFGSASGRITPEHRSVTYENRLPEAV